MTRIKWDEVGKRLYETGTKNGVLYPQESDGSYPKGVPWNGLTGVSANPSGGDANPFYADDQKYIELRGSEDFGGSINAYTYPDEWVECDGGKEIVSGVIAHQQTRKPFGFTWRTIIGNDTQKEDYGYKIHIAWNATASPSGRDYTTTNQSPDAVNMSWEFTTTPVKVNRAGVKPMSYLEIKSTAANIKALEDILYGTDDVAAVAATPATYKVTQDATKGDKTYYTRSEDNGQYTYTEFTGVAFENEVTYYEIDTPAVEGSDAIAGTAPYLPSIDEVLAILEGTSGS